MTPEEKKSVLAQLAEEWEDFPAGAQAEWTAGAVSDMSDWLVTFRRNGSVVERVVLWVREDHLSGALLLSDWLSED